MQSYLLLKMLHIFGVVLFLGNIIVTGFWKACADLSKDWKIIAFSQRLVTYTDIIFTAIGVVIIAVSGLTMAHKFDNFWNVRWIAWGLGLFIASGVIWGVILIPLQIKLHRLANQYQYETKVPEVYWRYETLWMLFGVIATLLPLMNLYWMVFKPN